MAAFTSMDKTNALTLQERFEALAAPYRSSLEWYCRNIAGSAWEADDLVQDTWLKAFAMFKRQPLRGDMSKAYLFRIASNTWIDRYRKSRLPVDSFEDQEQIASRSGVDPSEVEDAIETLVAHLPERQRAILLLVDVFQFSSGEAASMLGMTEGAVKAGLHRARTKLQSLRDSGKDDESSGAEERAKGRQVDEKLVYAYMEAFAQMDPAAIAMLHNDAAQPDLVKALTCTRSAGKIRSAERGHSANPLAYLRSCIGSFRFAA